MNVEYILKGEFKSTETRFIQQATIELLGCKETWTEDDKICILLTEQARKFKLGRNST